MPLPNSGQLSLNEIAGEFSDSVPNELSEFYSAAAGIPGSGQISIGEFYGASAEAPISATGGNSCFNDGTLRYHVFTSPGTFTVNSVAVGACPNVLCYYMLGGGGGGGAGFHGGGGGGAGAWKQGTFNASAGGMPVTIGGGASGSFTGGNGGTTSIPGIQACGGGGGGGQATDGRSRGTGGGGGSAGQQSPTNNSGGSGSQGGNGADGRAGPQAGGGGGGSAPGQNGGSGGYLKGGAGGPSASFCIPLCCYRSNVPHCAIDNLYAWGGLGGSGAGSTFTSTSAPMYVRTTSPATGPATLVYSAYGQVKQTYSNPRNGYPADACGSGGGAVGLYGQQGGNGSGGVVVIRYKYT